MFSPATTFLRRPPTTVAFSSSPPRFPSLDRVSTTHSSLRFARKLTTLLLSKPRHFLPYPILLRCVRYLNLPRRDLLRFVLRYPALFRLFRDRDDDSVVCIGLTEAAEEVAERERKVKEGIEVGLAGKVQRLLMMARDGRVLVKKFVHVAPDLGMPPNFRGKVLGGHPDRFRMVNTSYGWAVELVKWDDNLAVPIKKCLRKEEKMIIDRPLKFKQLKLRKGLNLKRRHRDYLLRFEELPEVSPYYPYADALRDGLAEKRACAVVREILAMTVEKRTLVDHLTHFRKEMGLPNKLRGMLVRHPEMFYISIKGQRDSVFLVEGYDDKGQLIEKDELVEAKKQLIELVKEGKRMRRERGRDTSYVDGCEEEDNEDEDGSDWIGDGDDSDDDLQDLFETGIDGDWEDFNSLDLDGIDLNIEEIGQDITALDFWTLKGGGDGGQAEQSRFW